MNKSIILHLLPLLLAAGLILPSMGCSKKSSPPAPPPTPPITAFKFSILTVNGINSGTTYYNVNTTPVIKFSFSTPIDHNTVSSGFTFKDNTGTAIPYTPTFSNGDSTLVIQPSSALKNITPYTVTVTSSLQSQSKQALQSGVSARLITAIDSTDKFPRIPDSALLDLAEQQTFKYFWDFGHPVSGLARERASSPDVVTTGGSGFGVMAILTGISRNFISRSDGLARVTKIVNFLADTTKVTRYHGAFSHWMDGGTGATVPFSTQDDGGDIVETSYMMQGLLCARQYFSSSTDPNEMNLRDSINKLWSAVDWSWYRQNNQQTLYWNWSPDHNWAINVSVGGWCEALITYVLAASAPADSIPRSVYDNGWAHGGAMKNGKSFYGVQLPLGPDYGGPLFFAHYSFLGINPSGLSDAYANYWTQDTAHARINYLYCVNNPNQFNGYSTACWGLTASDEQNGYSAHAPQNDDGVISPTAAISSLPYTPLESMNALRFFYYKLGDKIWGQYGFTDAFNLTNPWFDSDFLAIDQGPQIVMIENYRSGLLWNLFMSCPEIKTGMKKLGFQGPNL
jgi:hypothetical protein